MFIALFVPNLRAFFMNQAGGAGSTGFGRILDVNPVETHQRIPMYLGVSCHDEAESIRISFFDF